MRRAAVLVVLAACDTFSSQAPIDGSFIDDAPVPDARIVPVLRHTFVVDNFRLPASASEAMQLGLDLDDRPNDGIDNQLGTLLASLASLAPDLTLTASLDRGVDTGGVIALVDLRVDDLVGSGAAHVRIRTGGSPQPPPCEGAGDTLCRKHLRGDATFTVVSAADETLFGDLFSERIAAGPGTIVLPFRFGGSATVPLPLRRGRVDLALTPGSIRTGSKLGGAIARADLVTLVIPGIHAEVTALIDRDCPPPRQAPTCGCAPSSTGASVLGIFDGNDDCILSTAETRATIDGVLTSDIDLDGDGVNDAVSFGVGVTGVHAEFPEDP